MFATFVHNFDPIIFQFTERIALRWYGMAYLAGFLIGYYLLRNLARRKLWVLSADKAADFIAAAALLGVFLGGRLGYVLFYHIRREGISSVLNDPLLVLRVWDGGMASHGGILGLMIFTFFYARKHKVSWTGLGDGLCVVAPIGLFCGRMANFINGELYGRVASGLSWAVKFPGALMDSRAPESERFAEAFRAAADADSSFETKVEEFRLTGINAENQGYYFQQLLEANRESEKVNQAIGEYLEPRHPSQLYEGLLEGGLLFAILWFVRVKFPNAPHGTLTGLFFGLYATFRIFAEYFREPDAEWMIEGAVTMGQFLSFFMYLFAAGFLVYAFRSRKGISR